MNNIINIKYFNEKKRLVIFGLLMLLTLISSFYLLKQAYSSYQSNVKLNSNIDKAIYLLDTNTMNFNLDSDGIIPSDSPYVYKFSVSNFNDSDHSDVDLIYDIVLTTTTNLPITYELYRNENYDDEAATNILTVSKISKDIDGAWYNVFTPSSSFSFNYDKYSTDIYSLVIKFPKNYSLDLTYVNVIDNIEIAINSKQIIE